MAANAAKSVTVGLSLAVIGPPLLLCGVVIARRLLPRLAERHFDGQKTFLDWVALCWVPLYCQFAIACMGKDAVAGVVSGADVCLLDPTFWLLSQEAALRLGLLPPAGAASQDEAD